MPHSLSSMDRSEWQTPQCDTAISTCSSPSGPGSYSNAFNSPFGCCAANARTDMMLPPVVDSLPLRPSSRDLRDALAQDRARLAVAVVHLLLTPVGLRHRPAVGAQPVHLVGRGA